MHSKQGVEQTHLPLSVQIREQSAEEGRELHPEEQLHVTAHAFVEVRVRGRVDLRLQDRVQSVDEGQLLVEGGGERLESVLDDGLLGLAVVDGGQNRQKRGGGRRRGRRKALLGA